MSSWRNMNHGMLAKHDAQVVRQFSSYNDISKGCIQSWRHDAALSKVTLCAQQPLTIDIVRQK